MTPPSSLAPHATTRAAARLAARFEGDVFVPGDDGYEAGRRSWHRTIDPRPALVAEALSAGDVQAALLVARDHDLPFAVQSTGHGTLVAADGAVLVKTSRMAWVEVDPVRRTARVDPGARWSQVIDAVAPYGLAPLSGTTAVGVTGYTLGGGAGLLSRRYGFAADSVVRAEVVTADGDLVTVGPDEHPDLLWALRGGGPNFGVVTSLEFRLYPVAMVYGGIVLFAADRVAETLRCYREWALDEPDAMSTALMLLRMPDLPQVPEPVRGRRVLGLRALYDGDGDEAERLLAPLLAAAGEPLVDGLHTMTFPETSAITGPPPPPMAARQEFSLHRALPDPMIDALVEAGTDADSLVDAVELRHWSGAMAWQDAEGGPAGHRDVPFSVMAASPLDTGRPVDAVHASIDALATRLRPWSTGGSFLNFLTDTTRTATAFTADNYRLLREAKTAWDPDDVFRLGHHIPPTS
jgi:hypothetical protein